MTDSLIVACYGKEEIAYKLAIGYFIRTLAIARMALDSYNITTCRKEIQFCSKIKLPCKKLIFGLDKDSLQSINSTRNNVLLVVTSGIQCTWIKCEDLKHSCKFISLKQNVKKIPYKILMAYFNHVKRGHVSIGLTFILIRFCQCFTM